MGPTVMLQSASPFSP